MGQSPIISLYALLAIKECISLHPLFIDLFDLSNNYISGTYYCIDQILFGDEENTGIYDLSKGVMMSEIPLIFGKTIHYHLMVYIILFYIYL